MSSAASQERTQADVKQAFESITRAINALKPAVQKCKQKEDQEADPTTSDEYKLLSTVLTRIRRLEPKLLPAHYDLLVKMWNTIKADDNSEEVCTLPISDKAVSQEDVASHTLLTVILNQFSVFKDERVREILYGTKKENKIIKPPTLMNQKKNDETFQSLWEELKEATK